MFRRKRTGRIRVPGMTGARKGLASAAAPVDFSPLAAWARPGPRAPANAMNGQTPQKGRRHR